MQDGQSTFNGGWSTKMYHTFLLLDPTREKIQTTGNFVTNSFNEYITKPLNEFSAWMTKPLNQDDTAGTDGRRKQRNRCDKCIWWFSILVLVAFVAVAILLATGKLGSSPAAVATITSTTSTPFVAYEGELLVGGSGGSGETPVEYEGFTSETYEVYYDSENLGKAMQACGMITGPRYGKSGQCAVFFEDVSKPLYCTPFFTSCDGCQPASEDPTCHQNSLAANDYDPTILLFRSRELSNAYDYYTSFFATQTHIYPYGGGSAGIRVISPQEAEGATITSASLPFTHDCCSGNTYAVVTTNVGPFGAQIFNLKSRESAFLYHSYGNGWTMDYRAHAAAVGEFGNGDRTIALLYDADAKPSLPAGQYLGFYDNLADTTLASAGLCTLVDDEITACQKQNTARQVVKVFPDSDVAPVANNADLVFDSTNSYVLVTLGNLFALVSVPTEGQPAKVLVSPTTSTYRPNEVGFKAAFGPAPPAGSVRPQLFVVAFRFGVNFFSVNDLSFDKQVFFTPDGTLDDSGFGDVYSKNNFPDFTTEKILGVEWSSPEEVIVYREHSLQKVTVPGAVLMAYRGYNSLTYPQYYTGWPMSKDTPAPAMQACGMINTPAVLKNGQCAVFSSGGEQGLHAFCTPFQHLATGNIETTPGCRENAVVPQTSSNQGPILFRVNGEAGFVATATHVLNPSGTGAIPLMAITSASMPFKHDCCSGNTYAVVTTGIGAYIVNLGKGTYSQLRGVDYSGMYHAHAAAVGKFGNSGLTIALLHYGSYSADGTYLGFYDDLAASIGASCSDAGDDLITACNPDPQHVVKVFSDTPSATANNANNADLAFDSTNSYVLVTLGNLFALVAVPKDGKAAETPQFRMKINEEGNYKAAFAPPPPSGSGVRPQQLFVVAGTSASGSAVLFYDVTATDGVSFLGNVVFTSDGTSSGTREAFTADPLNEILGVEWSTLDEVIVYRKNSLQIVKVPDAVKAKYNGVEMETYESIYIIGADDGWPNDGVADFVSCTVAFDNNVNECAVWTANNNKCYSDQCMVDQADNIVAHYFHDGINLIVGSDNFITFYEGDIVSANLLANGDNNVVITGASDWWQDDSGTYYALITTATEIAIYDLKDTTKKEVVRFSAAEGNANYAAAAVTYNEVTTAAALAYDGEIFLFVWRNIGKDNHLLEQYDLKADTPSTKSNTLAFDTTGEYLLATFDNEWMLVDTSQSAVDLSSDAVIIHEDAALSNVQVAFSPSPTTFTTASGGTIAAGIFKQLYVVATKDKLEWYSVDQPGTLLDSIDGLNTAGDDIVSVQWLTQHEVVLFRSTSGRQHVPVPGKVFNVDRDDVALAFRKFTRLDQSFFSCADVICGVQSMQKTTSAMCPAKCSSSILDIDQYVNQNLLLQESLTAFSYPGSSIKPSTESCTTIDCNIWDTTSGANAAKLQNGALVAQFLCPETCKAPVPFGSKLHIHVSGACKESGINGDYEFDGEFYDLVGGGHNTYFSKADGVYVQYTYPVGGTHTTAQFEGNSYIDDPTKLPMGTRTWQVDCTPDDDPTDKIDQQVTLVAIPPPPPAEKDWGTLVDRNTVFDVVLSLAESSETFDTANTCKEWFDYAQTDATLDTVKAYCAADLYTFMCPVTCAGIVGTSIDQVTGNAALQDYLNGANVAIFKPATTTCNTIKTATPPCNVLSDPAIQTYDADRWHQGKLLAYFFCQDQCDEPEAPPPTFLANRNDVSELINFGNTCEERFTYVKSNLVDGTETDAEIMLGLCTTDVSAEWYALGPMCQQMCNAHVDNNGLEAWLTHLVGYTCAALEAQHGCQVDINNSQFSHSTDDQKVLASFACPTECPPE